MSAGTLCNREVIIAERTGSVLEAAQLMRQRHVGDVIVTEARNGHRIPVGIVTDRDIVIEVVAKGLRPQEVKIADIMSPEVAAVDEHAGVFETIQLMRTKGVRRMPIVDKEGSLVGMLSIDDLLELLAEEMTALSRVTPHARATEARARP
jgi:CBS domain-containing protein